MTNEEKAARLEGMAAKKDFAAEHAKSAVFGGGTWVAEFTADAALLREAAQFMREREGKSLLTERDWKGMYEAQERDMAALRKRVGELEADLATAGSNVHTLRDELREAQQQMAADAMLIAEAQRGAEIVADTERRLERRIAELEAERDAAKAGEARAVEALDVFARAYRVSMLPFAPGIDEADGAYHWMPHGWPSVGDFKLANSVLSGSSALHWLYQQEFEAAQAERIANTDTVRAMGPHFCDFFFGGPGEAEYLQQQLAAACREAAARELEQFMKNEWIEGFELKASIYARIAALTKQQPTACPRSEARGVENNNA